MSNTRLRVGMGDSYGLRVTVLAGPDFLPASVTGGTFKITKADGTTAVNWVGTLGVQSSVSVELLYAFSGSGADLDTVGTWTGWIQWTAPGKTPGPRSEVFEFQVIAANAR